MIAKRFITFGTLLTVVFTSLLSSPVGAQIYFSDDFENPAESEAKWEVLTGDWQVADGVYHQLATAGPWQASMVAADQWNDNWEEYTIEFKVKPLTTGDAPVNVLFRAGDPLPVEWADRNGPTAHFYRWIVNGWTNTESRPYIYNAGTATMLAQTENTLEVGVWHHIMLVVTKTDIAGYVNDVEMFDVEHAEWTDGRVGIQAYSGMMDFDDFMVYGPEHFPAWRLKARQPEPADGAVGVMAPLFRWKAGATGVLHEVYMGTTPELTEANLVGPRSPMTLYFHAPGLEPGATYYWRVDEIEADMATAHPGDVWSFVAQDVKAYYPTPADGSNTAALAPTLTWMPGTAVAEHHVYFGDSAEAVGQAAGETDKGTQTETTFAPEALEPLTAYFWRVDETTVGGEVETGPVWSFTTALPVDDFESYTDEEGSRIYETWIDGWTNSTGSTVGNIQAPFAEQTIVRSGLQSMPLDYNNVNSPFYSEAELEFSPTEDWTANGIDTVVLYVQGRSGNAAAPLYVSVEDSVGNAGTVVHPDPTIAKTATWIEWAIPLSDFTGVNMARVKKLILGAGDKADPKSGGVGRLYIDDIQVTRPAVP